MYNFHIFVFISYRSFVGLLKQVNDHPDGLLLQLEEHALHRYRRLHGFEFGTSLKFLQAFNCFNGFLLYGNPCCKLCQIRTT